MPTFVASYDLENIIPSPYAAFLKAARANGWSTHINGSSGKHYRLPNTTLTGNFSVEEDAIAALKKSRSDASADIGRNITMEKWIVAQYVDATFNSDETS